MNVLVSLWYLTQNLRSYFGHQPPDLRNEKFPLLITASGPNLLQLANTVPVAVAAVFAQNF